MSRMVVIALIVFVRSSAGVDALFSSRGAFPALSAISRNATSDNKQIWRSGSSGCSDHELALISRHLTGSVHSFFDTMLHNTLLHG